MFGFWTRYRLNFRCDTPTTAPDAFFYIKWNDYHEQLIRSKIGNPGDQARFEALALCIAVHTWRGTILASGGPPLFVGDALGMLEGAVKFRSKDSIINEIFMELALVFAPLGSTIEAARVWSEHNDIAD